MLLYLKQYFLLVLISFLFFSCGEADKKHKVDLIITNGTIIDLSEFGQNNNDVTDRVILIKSDTIFAIVSLEVSKGYSGKTIDAQGKFIIPGLVDGFATMNNQAYANAFLSLGITDIIGVDGFRRGPIFHEANPSPNVHMLREIGEYPVTNLALVDTIEMHANNGAEILLMMYELRPEQVKLAHETAKRLGMGTIGEMGFTSYKQGMDFGVDAFVHSTRYSLDVANDSLAKAVAASPFSNDLGSPKWTYYQFLANLEASNPSLLIHANNIKNSETFLIPTFSLLYPEFDFAKNPWDEPIAKTIDEKDINRPVNKNTGRHDYPEEELKAYQRMAEFQLRIEKQYSKAGAKYLAGSACDVWGTMPGISLHQELEVLSYVGLSNRQVLAAATTNFSEAYGFKFGKIEGGYKANILILDVSPIEDLLNLKGGKVLVLNGVEHKL